MDYEEMFQIYEEGDPDRLRTIAEYCAIDCALLEDLMMCKQILTQLVQLSRASRTMMGLTIGGQQRLVWNSMLAEAYTVLDMMPNMRILEKVDYFGAAVLEPKKGFYEVPIKVLDFQSLYPSITMAWNIDYSSILPPHLHAAALRLEGEKKVELVRTTAGGQDHLFMYHSLDHKPLPARLGVLPSMERRLKLLRCGVKAKMKRVKQQIKEAAAAEADDRARVLQVEYQNMDALQIAFKLLMNSAYGLAGASKGLCPYWPVAGSITAKGRQMIGDTKAACEALTLADMKAFASASPHVRPEHRDLVVSIDEGTDMGISVIYGDTDSVFVKFSQSVLRMDKLRMWAIGEVVAEYVTQTTFEHQPDVVLEMEKFYLGFMLIKKKKYVGRVFKSRTTRAPTAARAPWWCAGTPSPSSRPCTTACGT